MTDIDITSLNLKDPEPIEGAYQDASEYTPPPPEGQYYVQAPDTFEFSADKNGALQIKNLSLTITDQNQAGVGTKVRAYISTGKSKYRNGNTMLDYLRAHGIAEIPSTNSRYIELVQLTAGRVLVVSTQWQAYDKEFDYSLEGQDRFPKNEDGTRSFKGICPHNKKVIFARANVKRFVSQVDESSAPTA